MKAKSFLLLFLIVVLIFSGVRIRKGSSDHGATISLIDAMDMDSVFVGNPGDYLYVNIMIANASVEVAAWTIYLSYDTEMLYTDENLMEEGDFLSNVASTSSLQVFLQPGGVQIGCYLMQAGGATGDGWMAIVYFGVVGSGRCVIDLYDSHLTLYPSGEYEYPTEVDATFYSNWPKADFVYSTENHPSNYPGHQPPFSPVVNELITFNATVYVTAGGRYGGSYDPDTIAPGNPDGNIVSFEWNFGDGNTTSVTIPVITHAYDAVGTYPVTLTVTDDDGYTDSEEEDIPVVIHDIAIIDMEVHPTTVSPGELVSINITVLNEGTKDNWFNLTCYYDSTIIWYNETADPPKREFCLAMEQDPDEPQMQHPSLQPGENMIVNFTWNTFGVGGGTYDIWAYASLTDNMVQEVLGEADTADNTYDYGTVTVSPALEPPVADFTWSPLDPMVDEEVTFTSTSTDPDGTVDSWAWDFNNDGTIDAITEIATWTYTTADTYTVNLTVTDNDTLTDSETKSITVYAPPIASFTYLPTAPESGDTVTFNAAASDDPDGTIVSYAWDFGDENTGTGETTTHAYAADDTYTVILTVTDDDDLTGTDQKTVTVSAVPVHDVAVTNVTASPSEVVIGNSVFIDVTVANQGNMEETFNVTVYYDSTSIDIELDVTLSVGSNTILNFLWNTTGVVEGTYTIKANATEVSGEIDTTDNLFTDGTVTVSPVSMHDVAVTDITAPAEVTEGDNASIDVDVSNLGDFEETFNVTLTYDTTLIKTESITLTSENSTTISFTWNTTGVTPDTYTITAEAILSTDEDLTNNNATTSITVSSELDSPVASFTFTPTEPITSQTVTFNASASYDLDGTIVSYSWNFGDGNTGTEVTTTHAYTTGGTYTVTLTVTDNDGLTDTATQSISITGGKLSSSVSITVSPTAITIGKGTIIIGFITPARVGVNVTIESKVGEGDWSNITTVTTIQWGAYLYTWAPTAVGTYQLRARWLGDSITYANVSDVKTVTVKEMFGTISLGVTPPSVSFGSSVVIVGKVEPERPGVWVYINVRKNGGDWTLLLVMITDSKGNYSYEWTPTDTGTYELQAMCKYDIDILGSESEIKTIMVKAVGVPLDIYIYAAFVATTIILAGVLAVFFFRKRKT